MVGGGTYITVGGGGQDECGGTSGGVDTTFTSITLIPFGTSIVGEGGGVGGNYNGMKWFVRLDLRWFKWRKRIGSAGEKNSHNYQILYDGSYRLVGMWLLVKNPNLNLQGSYGGDGGVDTTLSGEYVTGVRRWTGEHGTVGGSNTYSVGGGWLIHMIMIDGSAPIVYGWWWRWWLVDTFLYVLWYLENQVGSGRGIGGTNSQDGNG